MPEINGELLGVNIAQALEAWGIPNTQENLDKVLQHIYNMVSDHSFVNDEVRWLCENDQLEASDV